MTVLTYTRLGNILFSEPYLLFTYYLMYFIDCSAILAEHTNSSFG